MNERQRALLIALGALLVPILLVASWSMAAGSRLRHGEDAPKVAVAQMSDDSYCTPQLKTIIRRVAGACGLIEGGGGRGCQPMQAKKVAQLTGDDFNAMFRPLQKRAHIIQFEPKNATLDAAAQDLLDKAWADQRGASFFFVVARASTDGSEATNEALSRDRAKAVLDHLTTKFKDPDLSKQVGLLWLGEQYAQLNEDFCKWSRSGGQGCNVADINRSAFVAWIDCAI